MRLPFANLNPITPAQAGVSCLKLCFQLPETPAFAGEIGGGEILDTPQIPAEAGIYGAPCGNEIPWTLHSAYQI